VFFPHSPSSFPAADISVLERQIDNVVYELYKLTPDEIAIVEGLEKSRSG
jgi:hypothetical protein